MKAILYVGAVLMAAASIYGFVDYKKSNKKLSGLYNKEQAPVSTTDASLQKANKEVASTVSTNPEVAVWNSESDKAINALVKNNEPEISKKSTSQKKESKKTSITNKKRKVNYKMYSRGALDDRHIEKEIKIEEPKKDTITSAMKDH